VYLLWAAAVPGYTSLPRTLASRRSTLPDGGNIGCAWENRWDDRQRDKDFTEKEVRLLQLIAPQIALAHQNAQAFTALKQAAARAIPAPQDFERIGLTVRESEVLHWVIQGKRDKEVADILSTSPRTIHNHLGSILRKLNTETRTAAASEAFARLKGSPASWDH
jgi:DNA-binding CsgD family transcriptional regulator